MRIGQTDPLRTVGRMGRKFKGTGSPHPPRFADSGAAFPASEPSPGHNARRSPASHPVATPSFRLAEMLIPCSVMRRLGAERGRYEMDRFPSLIAALRMLAKQTNPLHERLLTAERQIVDYVGTLGGFAAQSGLRRLREVARNEAKRPGESDFWISVREYIESKLSGP